MYKMYYTPTNTPLDGIVMASGIVFAAYNFLSVRNPTPKLHA